MWLCLVNFFAWEKIFANKKLFFTPPIPFICVQLLRGKHDLTGRNFFTRLNWNFFARWNLFHRKKLGGKCKRVILLCWSPPGPNLLYLLKKKPNYDKSLYLVHFLAMEASARINCRQILTKTSNGRGSFKPDQPRKVHHLLLLHLQIFWGSYICAAHTFSLLQLQVSENLRIYMFFS